MYDESRAATKASKRANGHGSVYKDRTRKRWVAKTVTGYKPDGTPVRRTVTARTQAEVLDRLTSMQRVEEVNPALPVEATVGEFLDVGLRDVLPLSDVREATVTHYAVIVHNYITPYIGSIRLDKLTPPDVRRMLTLLRGRGLSAATQQLARAVLRRALRSAEVDGLVVRNVAALTDGVRQDADAGRTLTPTQARELLDAVAGTDDEALVTLLLSVGLRKGEALGLSWDDLDLDAEMPTLRVTRALRKMRNGTVRMGEPKTARSKRTLHLPASLVPVLRRHRVAQAAQRLAFGEGWGGDWANLDLVFTTSIGTPLDPDALIRRLGKITSGAGLGRWTPHELRHSAASLALARGLPLKTVSEMLGHSSIATTADVYAHLMAPQRAEAAAAMEAALWG